MEDNCENNEAAVMDSRWGVALHVGNWPDGYQLVALQNDTQAPNVDRFLELAVRLSGFEKLRYAQIAMPRRGIYKCALYRPTHNFWRGSRF
jgi:hypothetical protein